MLLKNVPKRSSQSPQTFPVKKFFLQPGLCKVRTGWRRMAYRKMGMIKRGWKNTYDKMRMAWKKRGWKNTGDKMRLNNCQ